MEIREHRDTKTDGPNPGVLQTSGAFQIGGDANLQLSVEHPSQQTAIKWLQVDQFSAYMLDMFRNWKFF